MPDTNVNEDSQTVEAVHAELETAIADPVTKQHPESVPWSQYVGLKEKTRKIETRLQTRVTSLEEQVKNAAKVGTPEEIATLKTALETTKTELGKANEALKTFKDGSMTEKRTFLETKGVQKEKLASMGEKELEAVYSVLSTGVKDEPKAKPGPDLGSGGGATTLTGKPMDLARQAYANSK
jgi:hypothetical protein